MGLPIRVVFLTYGDNAETAFIAYRKRPVVRGKSVQAMGLVRHGEGLAAAGVLGLRPEQVTFLGYPDFRTLVMWAEHWGDCEPCSSMFTQTNVVPYENAFRPGTPYRADEILADIESILREFQPTKLFVSHPADHNPDHLSLYLFTRVALVEPERRAHRRARRAGAPAVPGSPSGLARSTGPESRAATGAAGQAREGRRLAGESLDAGRDRSQGSRTSDARHPVQDERQLSQLFHPCQRAVRRSSGDHAAAGELRCDFSPGRRATRWRSHRS